MTMETDDDRKEMTMAKPPINTLSLLVLLVTSLFIIVEMKGRSAADMAKKMDDMNTKMDGIVQQYNLPQETIVAANSPQESTAEVEVNTPRETCLDPNGPQPFILMTFGRGGSSSTWQIIGNLTGYEMDGEELTGSNPKKSRKFFEEQTSDEWLLSRGLCAKQLTYPKAGVVGFKWKPHDSIYSPSAQAALRTIATLQSPQIKVVRSRRNILDVIISGQKHKIYDGRNAEKVKAHCYKGDDACLQKGMNAATGLHLPTKKLLSKLRTMNSIENKVDKMLVDMKIPHIHVTYEELYYGKDTSMWMNLFKFLGKGPEEGLTKEQLQAAMEYQPTHASTHKEALENYKEVKELLEGTEFESLLH